MMNQSLAEQPVLSVEHLKKQYGSGCTYCNREEGTQLEGNYCSHCQTVYAVRDVSFDVYPGEVVGIVGESGSGKSTVIQSLYFDQQATGGRYYLHTLKGEKENLFKVSSQKQYFIRNQYLGMVYQNPLLGLKMNFSAISNIAEKMIKAGYLNVGNMKEKSLHLLEEVSIPVSRSKDVPAHFSGGMQQRVQIAKALATNPPVLLLDEVTTGLDLSVQADVLELIKSLQREWGISMVLVSHDLAVIRMLADRTLVMLEGKVIEEGLTDQILEDPQHAYTQKLVYSLL
jgi:putative phosphonate transport system ATP-binding protein